MAAPVITTVGDLVEDIVVWTSEPFHLATDTPATVHRHRGGSAANVASIVARLGGRARFIGNVGDDSIGDRLIADLSADGVDLVIRRHGRTGTLIVVVTPDGERSFFTDRGACIQLDEPQPEWLDGEVAALHVPAYSLTGEPLASTTKTIVQLAHQRAIPVSIDTSSTAIISTIGTSAFLELIETLRPDIVFANRDEGRLLGIGPNRPAPGAAVTVVRDGGIETHIVQADGHTITIAVPPVDAVRDTTGAGDGFAAGWLVATAGGADASAAAEAAHRTAARVLTQPGATLAEETA